MTSLSRVVEISKPTPTFLEGGGELGERMRAKDWSSTPLGPPESWPQSLKTAVRIVLTSRQPMFVWWGKELINLYNDAYKDIVGGKHPDALGQPASVVWREIWDQVVPRAESVMRRNEGTYDEALLLIMERNGYPEETHYTFSYSPVPNDEGGTGGIFCANSDDTRQIIGERQLALLRELAAATADARTIHDACTRSATALESNPRDIPFAMIYLVEPGQATLRLAGTAGISPNHPAAPEVARLNDAAAWPFAEILREHHPVLVTDLASRFPALPAGAWTRPPHQAVAVPIAPSGGTGKAGVLIVGLNPFRLFDDSYRGFIDLAAGQIAASIANAQAYEDERKRAESLAELDRAKTIFFSNVSHEFRTPLTLLLGPLEDVLATASEDDLSPRERELLRVAHRNGRRLLKLVNTLLDFSRIEAGRVEAVYEPTDLAIFTAELASAFRSAVDKAGIKLIIECDRLPEPAYVDRDMWEKIVLNLVSNAFKYTLEGGIKVTLRMVDGAIELKVRDTGTGIPEHELPRLFDRFHRVQGARGRTHEGTGIGLALVQELVRLHGGTVSVKSVLGKGSSFTVSIPRGRDHLPADRIVGPRLRSSTSIGADIFVEEARRWIPGAAEQAARDFEQSTGRSGILLRAPRRGRPRILLADDNQDMRNYVRRLLADDYDVATVSDGRSALQRIFDQPPDLVLTDVMMPKLDGFGLLSALRGDPRTGSIPVIMLSARAGEESRVEGLEAGADDYLVKPFSARELLARVKGVLALAKLRSEAKQREEELRAESTNILESLTEGFLACDAGWKITYANREIARVTAAGREELVGRTLWEVLPEVLEPPFEPAFRKAMTDRAAVQVDAHFERLGRFYEVHGFPIRSEGVAILFRDVTEHRLSESARRESEARFTRFMHHLPGLAWIKDEQGRYVFANESAMRAFGRSADALYGKTDAEIFPTGTSAEFRANDDRALVSDSGVQAEETLIHPDGSVHHSLVHKFAIPGAPGRPALIGGMAIDITERRRAEESLREADRRKDEFLAMLAHELRNPLAPIRTGLDLLAAQGIDDEAIGLMRDQVEHLVRLVDDLLDASRILRNRIQLRKKPVEMTATLQRAMQAVRPHLEAQQHELKVMGPPEPVWVDADPVRLTQVMTNLLQNAAKYTERGGHVEVTIREEGGDAVFAVRDDGVGIAPELLPKIFDLFTQADRSLERSQGGLGIGLTLVQSLVGLHGGRVSAHSAGEGKGSEFVVRIPSIRHTPQPEQSEGVETAAGEFHILVVEDNVGSAKILSRLLSTLGNHEIHLAHDGAAALEAARALNPDLILLDIGLPLMNGFDVARILRQDPAFDRTMLVALTGYGSDDDRKRAREAGFDMHLIKPPAIDVLQHLFEHPKLVRSRQNPTG